MTIHLRTWGDLACFTRPEMKVERVSYPVITPSAAWRRGTPLSVERPQNGACEPCVSVISTVAI